MVSENSKFSFMQFFKFKTKSNFDVEFLLRCLSMEHYDSASAILSMTFALIIENCQDLFNLNFILDLRMTSYDFD